jgi:hemerythrin
VAKIDDQHRTLAELAGRLHEALGSQQPVKQVLAALNELTSYTRMHFATEEDLMVEYGYPDYAAHRAAHREVLTQLQALSAHLRERISVRFDARGDIDDDWVTRHLLERDVELGRFLNSRGVF